MTTSSDIYIGCISGTSVDGLDLAAVRIDTRHSEILAATTVPLTAPLRATLLQMGQPDNDNLDIVGHTDAALGDFIAAAVNAFIADSGIDRQQIVAIGSHGQTIRHRPVAAATGPAFTLQIGDPNRIAEGTGLTTVADFRRRDMAAGGQGAPLVPPFHAHLFDHVGDHPVIVNIGGISNVTVLGETLSGFDTGPGNALLDAWCQRQRNTAYDDNGAWAASGTCIPALLDALLADPYFALSPPKSTGREQFHLDWLLAHEEIQGLAAEDVQATLAELTARCITDAMTQWCGEPSQVVVCGGGRLNSHLMARLNALCNAPVEPSETWQVDGDSIEAAAFAWLAYCTLNRIPGNAPSVTGASAPRVLGGIFPASQT